ncbi:MAG: hypothetical protein WBN81_03695 [Gammaproteobacteria bacterium]
MSRQNSMVSLSGALAMCLLSQACAAETVATLQTNPFINPYIGESEVTKEAVKNTPPPTVHELRGTMTGGAKSQANIGGVILTLGETIDGYKLVAVSQHHVVLDKDGTQKTLSLDADERNPGYE